MSRRLLILLFVLLALSGADPASAFGNCRDAGYLAGFDSRLSPTACRTVHTTAVTWRGGTAPVRVIVPSTGLPSEDEALFRGRVDELVRRVGRAMDEMGGLELGEVSILLSTLSFNNFHAVTRTPAGECKVNFFKIETDVSVDRFLFTLSHELFHCMQDQTWPEQNQDPEAHWWVEGTAEYFAHLANPRSSDADRFLVDFDADSPEMPLYEMEYPAQVFFLWLGQTQGAPAVGRFIGGMARTAGQAAQLEAMRRRIPMDTWMAFGQDYLDSRIRQPGGRELPGGIDQGRTTIIDGPDSVEALTFAYVLTRQQLLFKKGRTYRLAVVDGSGEFRSRFKESSGEWTDPPERVLACDEDKAYLVMSLATEGENVTYTIQVEDSERVDERACCLIGSWKPTPEAVRSEPDMALAHVGAFVAGAGLDFQCGVGGGGWTLEFTEDATGRVDWRGFTWRCVGREGGGSMSNTFTRNGRTDFNWTVLDRGVGRADYTANSLAWTHVMQFRTHVQSRVMPDSGPSASGNGFSFQCTDTTLEIQGLHGLNQKQGHYTRIGDRPDP